MYRFLQDVYIMYRFLQAGSHIVYMQSNSIQPTYKPANH